MSTPRSPVAGRASTSFFPSATPGGSGAPGAAATGLGDGGEPEAEPTLRSLMKQMNSMTALMTGMDCKLTGRLGELEKSFVDTRTEVKELRGRVEENEGKLSEQIKRVVGDELDKFRGDIVSMKSGSKNPHNDAALSERYWLSR